MSSCHLIRSGRTRLSTDDTMALTAQGAPGATGRRTWPLRQISIAVLLLVLGAGATSAQTQGANLADDPTFSVQVWGNVEFSERVWRYYALRLRLEEGLPVPTVTDDLTAIWRTEDILGRRVRAARQGAKQGDIFTPTSTVQFKRALRLVMTAQTWAVVMDDNPGEFSHRINGTYSKARPRSSMPYSILAQLPTLPDGIEYRFLGRHLVLHDTHANVILDRIHHAIRCADCRD